MVAYPKLFIDSGDLAGQIEEAYSAQTGITAFAGGGQASAVLLTRSFSRVNTVATSGDSVKLPPAVAGADMVVFNRGASSMNVFPSTGDAIGTGAANAAYPLANGRGARFICVVAGTWEVLLGAAS